LIRFVTRPGTTKGFHDCTVLCLHRVEDSCDSCQHLGHCKHPKGVPCRRGIDHDEVVLSGSAEAYDLQQRADFVDSRQCEPEQL
jgi:hypothetical protein